MALTKAELHEYGLTLFGERYQSRFAAALTAVRGKPVSQTQVSQWVAGPDGQRDPPLWLLPLVLHVARRERADLEQRMRHLDWLLQRDDRRARRLLAAADRHPEVRPLLDDAPEAEDDGPDLTP
ncbi:hypothetical protein [Methylorubrum populi]|uniref:hypothetical protein n=1 Tax=Methylorubrum populi TaxID=223967 RepID=UPI000DB1733D|nr:hypothetical protein [Methylorubrum populi]PZP68386.1 MAG: hypothetical protein DI590_16690 [Methylorubrum populi]